MALDNVTRNKTPSLAGGECAPRPRRQHAPAKGQRVGDRSVRGCCRAQAGARPPYIETSQKAPPCPAASCGACPGTTHGTSCHFRSVSEGCISRRGGAARPLAARNSRHRGQTRQPAAATSRPMYLKDDTITADDAEDALGTRTKTAPSAKTH